MKRFMALVIGLAVLATASGQDQQKQKRPGGFGGGFGASPLSLLSQKSVQEELKLNEETIKKATELAEKQRSGFNFKDFQGQSREDIQKKLAERNTATETALAGILSADQLKRVKQIALQQSGSGAFRQTTVVDALKLTDEQKTKITEIQDEARKTTQGLFQRGQQPTEEARKKLEESRAATNEKIQGLLTSEQKTKWKELVGEPFKGEIVRTPRPQQNQ